MGGKPAKCYIKCPDIGGLVTIYRYLGVLELARIV